MKIVERQIQLLEISEVAGLDPIRVMLGDLGPGQGRINIECWGKSWSNFWGGMGNGTLAQFFVSCDEHYLAGKLSNIPDQVFDPDRLKETLLSEVVRERQKRLIGQEEARERYDEIDEIHFPDNEAGLWGMSRQMQELMGDEWWYRIPKKENPDYTYLCRIIRTVQAALKELAHA